MALEDLIKRARREVLDESDSASIIQPGNLSQLKDFMQKVNYGLVDTSVGRLWKDTHKNTTEQDYFDHWRLLSPKEIIKYNHGICYDTTALSKRILDRLGIENKVYFAYCNKGDGPTHTFITYRNGNNWKWLEGSWQNFKNNKFSSPDRRELVSWIGKALANASGIQQQILQLNSYPKPGIKMKEFQRAVLRSPKYMVVDPDN